ncbi:MAG: branched-chain amino acid ABC transporter permease [Deltaproteobacteria bacterium]|nr:branched-chain amino acid ABC transporter permease [Deltaproteobacteria bacterium]
MPFLPSLLFAGIISTLAGLLVGLPSLRLRGLYLAITTFAFGFIVEHLSSSWVSLTRGANGLAVPPASIFGFSFDTDRRFFFLALPLTAAAVIFTRNLIRTRAGRSWAAVRDRDLAAEAIGISLFRYKLSAFCVSSFYAGVAGALSAHYLQYISPSNFGLFVSIQYLAMIIVGGLGSVLGTIFGALFMTLVPELLKILPDLLRESFPVIVERFADLNLTLFGLIIMLFVMFEPKGLNGIWQNIKTYWRMWPYTH